MADYREKIASNPKFEMIHISMEDEASHLEWASSANFPWPTINAEKAGEAIEALSEEVPGYVLLDRAGNVLANEKSVVFGKLK